MGKVRTPKDALTRVTGVTKAWETLRPNKSFGGRTLDQFKEIVKPSYDARDEIAELEGRMQAAMARRDAADVVSMQASQHAVQSVRGDPEEGEDGELYAAMGFVRKSLRNTGLTRRRAKEEAKTEGLV